MPPRLPLRAKTLRQLVSGKCCANAETAFLNRHGTLSSPANSIALLHAPQKSSQHLSSYSSPSSYRGFSTSQIHHKKKASKSTRDDSDSSDSPPASTKSSSSALEEDDPFDFSSLQTGIDKSLDKLKLDLSKLRTGGRFNTENLENLRVQLVKDEKGTERLGDLAQVIPKGGRSVTVLVGEKEHLKPLTSTILSSPLSLTPQPDPTNPLALTIPIPPPTKESRDLALSSASKVGETAHLGVKNARAAMQKRLRAMEVKKTVRPDDAKRAHKEMEKLVEKAGGEVKKMVEVARKGMEQ